ncbi:NUMOD3 domain-containing DNA-binding protein [Clostridium amazonitimonense]|uniref:NUMOD3 domain-containing DNA-binding protein n=1 Tax=Clostridium amazonitimonense TaxID=1499689 RepID=UPI000509D66E|nr:NUMOD3 domain-containing DNA-binding protein [Clostridium amazonitimonense]
MFYVYEWFIVDSLEVFYVGKGTGVRRFELHNRSEYFVSVYNKYKCAVRIVYGNLTNQQACELEKDRIYEMKIKGQAKCNFTLGGTGFSTGDLNPNSIHPPRGKLNPMYDVRMCGEANHFYGKKHSESTKKRISESRKGKGARFRADNPMFGSDKTKGERNGMYGVRGFDHPNSRMYEVYYLDGTTEILTYKQCEKRFGIAFTRIQWDGGVLHYKKKSINSIYEGTEVRKTR